MAVFVANPGFQGGVSYVLGQKRSRPWLDGADRGDSQQRKGVLGAIRYGRRPVKRGVPSKMVENAGTPQSRSGGYRQNRAKTPGCKGECSEPSLKMTGTKGRKLGIEAENAGTQGRKLGIEPENAGTQGRKL